MKRDYLHLLCDTGELTALVAGSADVEEFLKRMAAMVARHLATDVCSIYLCEEGSDTLVLRATMGLSADAVGKVRMRAGEGLVGQTIKELRPILDNRARENPHFKYFPEAHEDAFDSFLAAPIHRGVERIGVLVVQRREKNYFNAEDLVALRAVASQLAGSLESVWVLMEAREELRRPRGRVTRMRLVRGRAASAGFACAPATVLHRPEDGSGVLGVPGTAAARTLADFRLALEVTARQIEETQERMASTLPEVASLVFTAHLMMLRDGSFTGEMARRIENGMEPAAAVRDVVEQFVRVFGASRHACMREKVNDLHDIARRLLHNLASPGGVAATEAEGRVVVGRDLYPSDLVKLASEGAAGVVLLGGGVTTHVAILARSFHLPMVITDDPTFLQIEDGTPLLLDADIGNIYVNPTPEVEAPFRLREEARARVGNGGERMRDETFTRDGLRIHLLAAINLLGELPLALELKAEGVGLYRTEFPFMIRPEFPSEEEQVVTYRMLVERMGGREITFRTLDVGGDKILSYYDHGDEANPALGLRSIRFSFRHPDIFREQVRAILRAGAEVDRLRIMFPMISSLDDFRRARGMLVECLAQLAQEGLPHHADPKVGMMLELPSAVETIAELAAECDFFSVGTNDFVQYMLGVDRSNEKIAACFCPHHPAVLRALARAVTRIVEAGKDVSVCGEMAQNERYLPFLVGIGIRKLSVDPQFLPAAQTALSSLSGDACRAQANALLAASTVEATARLLGFESPEP